MADRFEHIFQCLWGCFVTGPDLCVSVRACGSGAASKEFYCKDEYLPIPMKAGN